MNTDDIRNYVQVLNFLLSIGSLTYAWLTAGSRANSTEIQKLRASHADDLAKLRAELQTEKEKVQALELEFRQVPTRDMMHALDLTVSKVEGSVAVLTESLQAVERTAHRIENFLLEKAGR